VTYSKQTWSDGAGSGTPINATRLNHIEDGIEAAAAAAGGVSTAQQSAIDAASTADRSRANHTGTQPATTISGLSAVATTGAYTDLVGRPTVPASPADIGAQAAATLAADTAAHINDGSALDSTLRAALVPFWKAGEILAAGAVRMTADGRAIVRNSDGTARPSYDAHQGSRRRCGRGVAEDHDHRSFRRKRAAWNDRQRDRGGYGGAGPVRRRQRGVRHR
jgi:hypothetical protein